MSKSVFLAVLTLVSCAAPDSESRDVVEPAPAEPTWVSLFNGRDLDGWQPKITGYALGENFGNTFRVEDGILSVRYDGYEAFDGRFGHLFFEQPFANYDLRVVYRFVGEQAPGGPGWARRNSGIMLHCQSPESMAVEQNFPVSIEAQMLGEDAGVERDRPTANLCTPGTHVEMGGELVTRHCTNSASATFYGDEWVTMEVQVRGNELIRHLIDGETVLEYQRPQLDPNDGDAKALLAAGADTQLDRGWFSLQAESHPIDFKSVEIRALD